MKDNLPPCEMDDLIVQTISFDNLKKYLTYIENCTNKAFSQISELKMKLLEIEEIKSNLNEINNRLDIVTTRFVEFEQGLHNQQMKILEVERKFQGQEEVKMKFKKKENDAY